MKSFALACLATAASAYRLMDYSKSKTELILDNRIGVNLNFSTEWYWGIRNPVMWAEYMKWHEAWVAVNEFYTYAYADAGALVTLHYGSGEVFFGLGVYPKLQFWDIALAENLMAVWQKKPRENYCFYTGWWMEIMYFFVDIAVMLRECKVGTYDYLVDSGKFKCYTATYYVSEAYYEPVTKLARYVEGMYDMDWNTCQDYDSFTMHETVVRSIGEAFDDLQDDANDDDAFEV